MLRASVGVAVVLAALTANERSARAYEFWLRAQSIGQAYQLRDFRLVGPDLFLGRRRYTQTLALRITDIGDFSRDRRRKHLPDRGLRISWQSYLRIDHDFGDYTSGQIQLPSNTPRQDAIDVIPELAESSAGLDLMYGYLQFDGLADDKLRFQLGRILADDGWGSTAYDGASARYELPAPIAVQASAGFRVRAASPLGVSAYELDGTSGAGCQEYVEGPTPGSGTWKLIDRERTIQNTRLTSDFAYCPQRDVRQPTVGVSIATTKIHGFGAELGYRRTWSDTVGLIGPVDRLQFPDLGLYPNDFGQAPSSGVDEERLWARAHGELHAGGVTISPYIDGRYAILQGVLDRADLGVRLQRGDHILEPAVEYFFPTFDGDSIFNVFSIEPTTDVRLSYQYAPAGALRGTANAWLRKYAHEDGTSSVAGGGEVGVERTVARDWKGRIDALWDDGYGGRRVGGTTEVMWRPASILWLRGRAIVLDIHEDGDLARHVVTSTVMFSSTWRVADSVAVHAIAEADYDDVHALQTRAIAVLDLAFMPEP